MIRSKIARTAFFLLVIGTLSMAGQNAPQAVAPPEGETLHVLVGKSIVINVETPLTRVLSSNPAAVETLATSATQVVIEGKAAGSSSLILWDTTGRSQVFDVVTDVDIAGLRNTIQKAYPNEHLEVDADGGRLLLTGTASNAHIVDDLGKMAGVYSKDVVNTVSVPLTHDRQILLEVKIAEVDRSAITQLGINLFSLNGKLIANSTTGQFGGFNGANVTQGPPVGGTASVTQLLNIFMFRPDIGLGTMIQALQDQNVLQILAEPNLLALSGQKATFLAGGEFPYILVQPSAGLTTYSVTFKPFGVKLDFTGFVQEDNTIRLHVSPEVSTLDFSQAVAVPGGGGSLPSLSTRRAETEIELQDGQTFGIAGLLDQRATEQLSKVPGIGDIPILGQFFRSRSITKSNNELLVFVTPHIVDPIHVAKTAPVEPKLVVPFLEKKPFDEKIPGNKEVGTTPQAAGAK
jgi:pilus assembly protein CpaC